MYFIVREIFAYLNEDSLRVCESVSQQWNLAVSDCKMWTKLYQKEQQQFLIRGLKARMQAIGWQNSTPKADESWFKKLFDAKLHVEKNWQIGNYRIDEATIRNCRVITVTFDTKRIVFGVIPVNYFGFSKIIVCNRWTLDVECVLNCPIQQWITKVHIDGDIIYCSHLEGNIYIWDLQTKEIITIMKKDELLQWTKSYLAHGFFVACYFTGTQSNLVVSIRRISKPISDMKVEKILRISGSVLRNVDIDKDYLVLSLCRLSFTVYAIQIRSTQHDFSIIHELDFSYDPFFNYSYGNGYLVASLFEEGRENIKLWDIETLKLKATWIENRRFGDRRTNFVSLSHSRLIIETTHNADFVVYDLNSLPITDRNPFFSKQTKPKVLFRIESKLHSHTLVDDLQLIIISQTPIFTSTPFTYILTAYNFCTFEK
jgi:hypothetical protein